MPRGATEGGKIMINFRPLRADEVKVRVSQINEKNCVLLLYKDSRCDMNILDECVGADRWQRRHYECKGNLYCSVGILGSSGEWVWKDDCGTEGYTEKEKSEASDSFKRACTNWGIGRELYTAPVLKVKSEKVGAYENDKGKYATNAHFNVMEYEVERGVITKLTIHAEYWARMADGKLGIITNVLEFKCNKPPVEDKADTNRLYQNVEGVQLDSKN
jgi:hypothetical protein